MDLMTETIANLARDKVGMAERADMNRPFTSTRRHLYGLTFISAPRGPWKPTCIRAKRSCWTDNTQPFMHFIHESNVCSCPLPSSLSFKPSTILYCAEALNCNCLQIYTQIYRNIEKYSPYAIVILYALEPPETLLVKELLLALPPCHTSFVVAIQCTGLGFNEASPI